MFVRCYRYLFFAKNMSKDIGKKLSGKCSQKLLDHAKQYVTDALKTASNRAKL